MLPLAREQSGALREHLGGAVSARIDSTGRAFQLDSRADVDEQITEADAENPARVARLLTRILKDVASLKRRWIPRRIDFEDIAVDNTGTTKYRFSHRFGARVRWWAVDWQSASSAGESLRRHSDSDADTLVLVSHVSGTVSVRVEEAG